MLTTKNNPTDIYTAICDYGIYSGCKVDEDTAWDVADLVHDTHFEERDEYIDFDIDELDQAFNIYSF